MISPRGAARIAPLLARGLTRKHCGDPEGAYDHYYATALQNLRPLVTGLREAAEAIDPRPAVRVASKALRDAATGRGVPAAVGVSY